MPKIYTRTGDQGETGLFGGPRVRKSALRVRAYGEVDEANASLGVARALNGEAALDTILKKIQNSLFDLGADSALITEEEVTFLEKTIDHYENGLPPLKNFILPAGSPLAAALQVARSVVRRAEREIVALEEKEKMKGSVLSYINRLSDLLFVLARWANQRAGVPETLWQQKKGGARATRSDSDDSGGS